MGNRSRQLRDHGDFRSFVQLRPGLPKVILGLFAVVDVDGKPVPLNNLSFRIKERFAHYMVPAIFAVPAPQPMDRVERFSGLNRFEKISCSGFKLVWMVELLPSEVQEFLERP